MSEQVESEMIRVLKSAMEAGSVLDIASEAKRIAALYNVDVETVARDLTESGLLAGANMAMGTR